MTKTFEGSKELLRLLGVSLEMYLNMTLAGTKYAIINLHLSAVAIQVEFSLIREITLAENNLCLLKIIRTCSTREMLLGPGIY